jgi:hypothetical protein
MNTLGVEKCLKDLRTSNEKNGHFYLKQIRRHIWISKNRENKLIIIFILKKDTARKEYAIYGKLGYEVILGAKIVSNAKTTNEDICLVSLTEEEPKKAFLYFLESLYIYKDPKRLENQEEIKKYLQDWKDLFTNEVPLSREEQIGLWGELYFISKFKSPDKVIEKWRGPENKTFDFVTRNELIDIKTSIESTSHYFSLNQVAGRRPIYIFAYEVAEDLSGISVSDLIEQINKRAHNKGLFFVRLVKTRVLNTLPQRTRYIPIQQRLIKGSNIPQPRRIDKGVEKVRFKSETCNSKSESSVKLASILKNLQL